MKKITILICFMLLCLPGFAKREYYIKNDTDYNLQFLCFNERDCYSLNPNIIKIKNKNFVGFGAFHYYDLSTYWYNQSTHTYNVDILVDRDPSTDLDICDKCPYDRGNITHLIFSLEYNPLIKKINATYKGFVSSEDVVQYSNGKPISHYINYLNVYYDENSKYIKDLSDWLNFFNKKVIKTFCQPNSSNYGVEIEYIIPYYVNVFQGQYNPKD